MEPNLQPELHVAVFSLRDEPLLVTPAATRERKVELFRTQLDGANPANERTAGNLVADSRYNLTSTSALQSIGSIEGDDGSRHIGYALRIAEEDERRNFAVKKLELIDLLKYLDPAQTFLDPIDRAFLVRCLELPIIAAKLHRQIQQQEALLEVNE